MKSVSWKIRPVSQDSQRKSRRKDDQGRSDETQRALLWGYRAALFIVLMGLWQASVDLGLAQKFYISTPLDISKFLREQIVTGELWLPLRVTFQEMILAFVIGACGGILVALILSRFRLLDRILQPFFTAMNALPRVALAPLFVLWFGIGQSSKVYLGVSLTFFIVLIATQAAIVSVDQDYIRVARGFGASPVDTVKKIILPAIVPGVFGGLRIGIIYSLLGVVTGEMIAAETGLGQQLVYYASVFNTAGVMANLAILAMLALFINEVTVATERRIGRWQGRVA